MSDVLQKELASMNARFQRLPSGVVGKLQISKGSEDRERLAGHLGLDTGLPGELDVWFAHHDGQPDSEKGIDPDAEAVYWLSLEDVRESWDFLSDEMEEILQPWSSDWLPIAANGGGDYIVYVMRGKKSGKLLWYYHDDEERPLVATSLLTYVKGVNRRLGSLAASLKQKKNAPSGVTEDSALWENDVPEPSLDDLAASPLGTAYHTRALPYPSYWYRVFVKISKGKWIQGKARLDSQRDDDVDISGALSDICERLREMTQREWKVTEAELAHKLSDEKVYPTDLTALKGEPSLGNPYFLRRRATLTFK